MSRNLVPKNMEKGGDFQIKFQNQEKVEINQHLKLSDKNSTTELVYFLLSSMVIVCDGFSRLTEIQGLARVLSILYKNNPGRLFCAYLTTYFSSFTLKFNHK